MELFGFHTLSMCHSFSGPGNEGRDEHAESTPRHIVCTGMVWKAKGIEHIAAQPGLSE
jgi:hypothetical protein